MRLFLIHILLLLCFSSWSQTESQNSVTIEGAGNCYYGALKYERWLLNNESIRIGPTVGLSVHRLTDNTHRFNPHWLIPIGARIETIHKWFALGEISSIIDGKPITDGYDVSVHYSALLGGGYRFNKNISLSAGYVPIFGNHQRIVNWFSISMHVDF